MFGSDVLPLITACLTSRKTCLLTGVNEVRLTSRSRSRVVIAAPCDLVATSSAWSCAGSRYATKEVSMLDVENVIDFDTEERLTCWTLDWLLFWHGCPLQETESHRRTTLAIKGENQRPEVVVFLAAELIETTLGLGSPDSVDLLQ